MGEHTAPGTRELLASFVDMTIREFLRAFLLHACGAFLLWFAMCVAFETFMPGFVTPFADIADLGVVALAAAVIGVLVSRNMTSPPSLAKRWLAIAAMLVVIAALIAVLAFAITPGGRIQFLLIGAAVVTSILILYALLTSPLNV